MDLAEVLDSTQPVEVDLMGQKIVAHVFTAGYERLRLEDRQRLERLREAAEPVNKELADLETEIATLNGSNPERAAVLESKQTELKMEASGHIVLISREMVPLMVARWESDGLPLLYKGEEFPPTFENVSKLPDTFVLAIANSAGELWAESRRPMEPSPAGLQPEARSAQPQIETTTN